jgi:hypothetical protein
MPALNNLPTSDGYTLAATLKSPGTVRLVIHVRNAAIYYQLGDGWPAIAWRVDEVFLPPGTATLERNCDAIRVRNGAVGKPAQVTIEAATRAEVPGGGG